MPHKPASRLARAAVAVLCVFVLALVWIAAWRVKARKLAGRAGDSEAIEAPAGPLPRLKSDADPVPFFALHSGREVEVELPPQAPAGRQQRILDLSLKHGVPVRFVCGDGVPLRLTLHRGQDLAVEHFTLSHATGRPSIRDRAGRPLVEFFRRVPGEVLRWQELQLTPVEVDRDFITFDARLSPGARCSGIGRYHQVRTGLQIELAGPHLLTVLRVDDASTRVRIDEEEADVTASSPLRRHGFTVEFRNPGLLITSDR